MRRLYRYRFAKYAVVFCVLTSTIALSTSTEASCNKISTIKVSESVESPKIDKRTQDEKSPQDVTVQDNTIQEESTQEETTQEGTPQEETPQEGTTQEESTTTDQPTPDIPPEDIATPDEFEEKPEYKKVNQVIYLKAKTSIYEEADETSKKLGTAIEYKQYTRIGIGENGYDKVIYEDKEGYVKQSKILLKKPKVPSDIVNIDDKLYSYIDMKKDLQSLSIYYPDYLTIKSIGTTSDNRNIYCAILGNPDAKKHIILQGSMHAREYINSQLLMAQLEYYLSVYESGSYNNVSYQQLFDEVCVHIMPMTNPDGVTLSQYGLSGINDKALVADLKKMQRSKYYSRWKANAKGVDLNRNFPYRWSENSSVKKRGSMNYPGASSQTEKETKAIMAYTKSISGLRAALSYHSMGNVIYWDYGQKGKLRKQCKQLVDLVKQKTGYSLITLSSKNISYGGYSDWVVGDLGIPAITIETGVVYAPVSHNQFKTIWKQNKEVIPAVAMQVRGK